MLCCKDRFLDYLGNTWEVVGVTYSSALVQVVAVTEAGEHRGIHLGSRTHIAPNSEVIILKGAEDAIHKTRRTRKAGTCADNVA